MSRLSALLFACGLAVTACAGQPPATLPPERLIDKAPSGPRLIAEFEPTEAIWLAGYPQSASLMQVTIDLVRALQPHVALMVVSIDEADTNLTRKKLTDAGIDVSQIKFLVHPHSEYFFRGPGGYFYTDGKGGLGVIDFKWTQYGLEGWCALLFLAPEDARRANQCASYANFETDVVDRWVAEQLDAAVFDSTLVLEGGAFETNGRGAVIVSEPLMLQRHPGRGKAELEAEFLKLPGVRTVVWMADGLADDPLLRSTIVDHYVGFGTGGHADEFVRFVDEDTVMLAWVEEDEAERHPVSRINRARMLANLEILSAATDADGNPFEIIRVPMPAPIEEEYELTEEWAGGEGWSFREFPSSEGRKPGDKVVHVAASSYLNFIIANDAVLVPSFVADGTDADVEAAVLQIFGAAFPGKTIKTINATTLNWSGGGPHCVTNNQPEIVSNH